jgi:hypothetical protein
VTRIPRPVLRTSTLSAAFALISALTLAGIWSNDNAGATTSKTSVKHTCQMVAAILADGPDPDVDPVGYALAQVHPLRGITTSDEPLKKSIDRLSSAYQAFYKDNGAKEAETLVAKAAKSLNAYCPGAVS